MKIHVLTVSLLVSTVALAQTGNDADVYAKKEACDKYRLPHRLQWRAGFESCLAVEEAWNNSQLGKQKAAADAKEQADMTAINDLAKKLSK